MTTLTGAAEVKPAADAAPEIQALGLVGKLDQLLWGSERDPDTEGVATVAWVKVVH